MGRLTGNSRVLADIAVDGIEDAATEFRQTWRLEDEDADTSPLGIMRWAGRMKKQIEDLRKSLDLVEDVVKTDLWSVAGKE